MPGPAGSEVVRLYEAVLGKEGFRKGMDLYFKRHDGQVNSTRAVWWSHLAGCCRVLPGGHGTCTSSATTGG